MRSKRVYLGIMQVDTITAERNVMTRNTDDKTDSLESGLIMLLLVVAYCPGGAAQHEGEPVDLRRQGQGAG